jgi:hypothetical protein
MSFVGDTILVLSGVSDQPPDPLRETIFVESRRKLNQRNHPAGLVHRNLGRSCGL